MPTLNKTRLSFQAHLFQHPLGVIAADIEVHPWLYPCKGPNALLVAFLFPLVTDAMQT